MYITHTYNIHYVINTPHSDTTKLQLLPAENMAVCTRLKQKEYSSSHKLYPKKAYAC